MKKQHKLWALALFTVVSAVIFGFLLLRPKWPPEVPGHQPRIDAIIATLKKENLEESMDRLLSDDDQYYYPGYYTGVINDQIDLEIMLSDRRSIKVLQSIEKLPAKEREAKCKQLFSKAFRPIPMHFTQS